MSSVSTGNSGEDIAAKYLKKHGFKIVNRNWKNRYCEIDIIASKQDRIFFVEVKYRSSRKWGNGLDYITPTKLTQMQFAAKNWIQSNKYNGDYTLSGMAVNAEGVEEFVEEILC